MWKCLPLRFLFNLFPFTLNICPLVLDSPNLGKRLLFSPKPQRTSLIKDALTLYRSMITLDHDTRFIYNSRLTSTGQQCPWEQTVRGIWNCCNEGLVHELQHASLTKKTHSSQKWLQTVAYLLQAQLCKLTNIQFLVLLHFNTFHASKKRCTMNDHSRCFVQFRCYESANIFDQTALVHIRDFPRLIIRTNISIITTTMFRKIFALKFFVCPEVARTSRIFPKGNFSHCWVIFFFVGLMEENWFTSHYPGTVWLATSKILVTLVVT